MKIKPLRPHQHRTVAIIISRSVKSGRDRLQGSLRILAKRRDLAVACYRTENIRKSQRIAADAVIIQTFDFRGRTDPGAFTVKIANVPHRQDGKFHYLYDNAAIAEAAAKLLLRRGYRSFAYIGTDIPLELTNSDERGDAFAAFVRAQDFPCAIYRADPEAVEPIDDLGALREFLVAIPKPCGVMLYADDRAQIVYEACRQARLSIPDQVAIVGVDNETDICEAMNPTLTSILPDFIGSGEDAALLVLRHLNGERLNPCTVKYGVRAVYERDSTIDLRRGGQIAARIDACLRERFVRGETISTMLAHFGASRRLLEIRFREIFNCSILERLTSYRLEEAKRLLKSTSATISEVAIKSGFRTNAAFIKAFTAATGRSPRKWRQSRPEATEKP